MTNSQTVRLVAIDSSKTLFDISMFESNADAEKALKESVKQMISKLEKKGGPILVRQTDKETVIKSNNYAVKYFITNENAVVVLFADTLNASFDVDVFPDKDKAREAIEHDFALNFKNKNLSFQNKTLNKINDFCFGYTDENTDVKWLILHLD